MLRSERAAPSALRHAGGWAESALLSIASAAASDAAAAAAAARLLGGLKRADAERGSDLAATLQTYYRNGGNVAKTAQALFLHRNSVRYRLDRVRCLLRCDIDHPLCAAAIVAAFAIVELSQRQGRSAAQRT
ncbi:MAG: helix-turn-helix domain-containing protein [Candidatus Eremiobacteraeota bacterium]|nr:helix-turn-helix domain-containing protein [Candidatus Eremiobacteraeota bacterium]